MRLITLIVFGTETVTDDAVVGFVGEKGEVTNEFRGMDFQDCFCKLGAVLDSERKHA
jgi:hypothetical protein